MFRTLILTSLLVGLAACEETTETKLQYMPDMADSPAPKAQRSFLNPPDNSVAINAILYPEDPAVGEKEFKNPLPANEYMLEQGKKFFNIYCAVCHGPDGKGHGTLTANYPVGVPDISRPDMKAREDGFFFMKISKGGPMMPSYGHATSPGERWQIIHYLRTLQNG